MTAVVLLLVAALLAVPVPRLLVRATWPYRCPRAAIVLWQAIGLAGGVALLGAGLALSVAPLGASVPDGVAALWHGIATGRPQHRLHIANVIGLALTTLLAIRLASVLTTSTAAVLRSRRRQRELLDLAAHGRHVVCERRPRGLRVLDHPVAVAYCVPGVRPRVVISAGTLATLGTDELDAVLAHEEAHARGRHDLVVQPFVAWQATFPFLRTARDATAAVSLLVEMLADDAAARRTGTDVLAAALVRLGASRAPRGVLAATGVSRAAFGTVLREAAAEEREFGAVVARVRRLLEPAPPAPWWLPASAYVAAVTILTTTGTLLATG